MPKKQPPIQAIVCIADTHCGSSKGILPPGFKSSEGNEICLNAYQEWLWECWEKAHEFVVDTMDGDPFALVLNGDLIEGIHHGTKEIISADYSDHISAAVQAIKPFAELSQKRFVVRGTECHTGNSEEAVASQIGATINPDTGTRTFDRLVVDLNDIRHVFRHHIGTSLRRSTSGGQLSVQLAEEQIEAANNHEKIPQVLCCAHRHKFGKYEDENGLVVVSPPWQVLTRFGHKVVSQARTKPGLFILDYRDKPRGGLPEVRARTFSTPEGTAISV